MSPKLCFLDVMRSELCWNSPFVPNCTGDCVGWVELYWRLRWLSRIVREAALVESNCTVGCVLLTPRLVRHFVLDVARTRTSSIQFSWQFRWQNCVSEWTDETGRGHLQSWGGGGVILDVKKFLHHVRVVQCVVHQSHMRFAWSHSLASYLPTLCVIGDGYWNLRRIVIWVRGSARILFLNWKE
jgi:hypothetical protein